MRISNLYRLYLPSLLYLYILSCKKNRLELLLTGNISNAVGTSFVNTKRLYMPAGIHRDLCAQELKPILPSGTLSAKMFGQGAIYPGSRVPRMAACQPEEKHPLTGRPVWCHPRQTIDALIDAIRIDATKQTFFTETFLTQVRTIYKDVTKHLFVMFALIFIVKLRTRTHDVSDTNNMIVNSLDLWPHRWSIYIKLSLG